MAGLTTTFEGSDKRWEQSLVAGERTEVSVGHTQAMAAVEGVSKGIVGVAVSACLLAAVYSALQGGMLESSGLAATIAIVLAVAGIVVSVMDGRRIMREARER